MLLIRTHLHGNVVVNAVLGSEEAIEKPVSRLQLDRLVVRNAVDTEGHVECAPMSTPESVVLHEHE